MEYIKEHKKQIIVIAIIVVLLIILGIIIFTGDDNNPNNNNRQYEEPKQKYKINEVVPIYTDQEQMAKKYLAEYVNLLIFDEQQAFELLDENFKQKQFSGDFNAFSRFIKSIKTKKFIQAKVTGYDTRNVNGQKYYYIKDADKNEFIFKESSIRNYTVEID